MKNIASEEAIQKSNIEIEDLSAVEGLLIGLLVSIPIWGLIVIIAKNWDLILQAVSDYVLNH